METGNLAVLLQNTEGINQIKWIESILDKIEEVTEIDPLSSKLATPLIEHLHFTLRLVEKAKEVNDAS